MLYEGIKETENTRIEKDTENSDEIEMLYSFGVVLFEHVILESENYTYSLCYFAPQDIYDVVIEKKKEKKIVTFETKKELNENLKRYFELNKNDTLIVDNEEVRCMSHSIEYTL